MDPVKVIEERLDVKVSKGEKGLKLSGECWEAEVPPLSALAIATFVRKEKAIPIIRMLFGDGNLEELYKEYLKYPFGRVCWLYKTLAKLITMRMSGKSPEELSSKLEEEVAKRWPNVCGQVDAMDEATKLVTEMNEKGMSASASLQENEVVIRTQWGFMRVKRREPSHAKLLAELRKLLHDDPSRFREVVEFLSSDHASCFDLAEAVYKMSELKDYGFIRAYLREIAEKLAEDIVFKVKR